MGMTTDRMEEICQSAVLTYGIDHQCLKACEECGELIRAISRARENGEILNLIEEIADVRIMMEQLMYIYSIRKDDILEVEWSKLERLERRMDDGR